MRVIPALLVVMLTATPASAWGIAAHRFITARAIDALPAPLKTFFERRRDEFVLRSLDPDLWRLAGWDEDAHHYINFGVDEYGAFPFAALPRDRAAATKTFGAATLKRYGLLPWRADEMFGRLQEAFARMGRRAPTAPNDIIFFSAVTAHYIQDAHQPLHATNNHDGQLTGQSGLHVRFETALFDRYQSRLTIRPERPMAMRSARDASFDILLASYRLVDPLLAADRAAARAQPGYGDEYYERLFEQAGPILERRITDSITATAALIIGAWEQAGRPRL